MAQKRLITMKEACDYLGVSRMTLLKAEEEGLVRPETTPGGHRRYTIESLEMYLRSARTAHEERQFVAPTHSGFLLPQFISRLSAQPVAPDELLNEALRNLVLLLQADVGAVFVVDEGGQLRLYASFGIPHWVLKDSVVLGKHGLSAEALRRQQPLAYAVAESEIPLHFEVGQGICAPLLYRNEALGVVQVISSNRHQFFPSEINILATIAVYLASLIVNSQMLAQQQAYLKELSLLNRLGLAMETRAELDPVLQVFLDETLSVIGADGGAVFLHDPSGERLYVRAAKGYPEAIYQLILQRGEGITGWVIEHDQPRISPRLDEDPLFSKRAAFLVGEVISNICLPLRSAGEMIGAFHISTHAARAFSPDEIRFLTTAGNQAAVIIHRAMLLEEASRQAQAEHSLRDYYEIAIENLPVAMVAVNADFRVVIWNSAMECMTKVMRAEGIGRDPREVFPPMKKGWQMLEESLRTGEDRLIGPYEHTTPRGELGLCEARIIPIRDSSSNLTSAVLYVREIDGAADRGKL